MIRAFLLDVAAGLAVGVLLGALLYSCDASAQEPDDATALVLAIAFVAEAGWDAEQDHAAIGHALRKRADRRGITLQQQAVEYVSAFRVASPRSRWLLALSLDARKPAGWPAALSWAAHVPRWLRVVERARAFLRGELRDPCGAEHWGGAMDVPRGRMVRASCSTRNTFYRLGARKEKS